jgi:hypothetical protein
MQVGILSAVFSYMVIIFIQNETISWDNFFSLVTGFTFVLSPH